MSAPRPIDPPGEPELSVERFLRPLDVLRVDHDRQEVFCRRLDALAAEPRSEPDTDGFAALLAHLTDELPIHTRDEEEDLFPLLLARALPVDGIDEVLAQLSREHALDIDLADFIAADMRAVVEHIAQVPPMRFYINARAFAETQRRHLGWENRLVLPLARDRLTPLDLEVMGRKMAARRGLTYPD